MWETHDPMRREPSDPSGQLVDHQPCEWVQLSSEEKSAWITTHRLRRHINVCSFKSLHFEVAYSTALSWQKCMIEGDKLFILRRWNNIFPSPPAQHNYKPWTLNIKKKSEKTWKGVEKRQTEERTHDQKDDGLISHRVAFLPLCPRLRAGETGDPDVPMGANAVLWPRDQERSSSEGKNISVIMNLLQTNTKENTMIPHQFPPAH